MVPAFLQTILAICLKKPTSSKKIDTRVIEIKRHNILRGLIASVDVNPLKTVDSDTREVIIINNAPVRATTQYVPIPKFFIFILGKNKIEVINVIQVIAEITIVRTIIFTKQDRIIALTKVIVYIKTKLLEINSKRCFLIISFSYFKIALRVSTYRANKWRILTNN